MHRRWLLVPGLVGVLCYSGGGLWQSEQAVLSADENDTAVVAESGEMQTNVREASARTVEEEVRQIDRPDEVAAKLPLGKIVRPFGWQEEDGVWRYHTGVDIALQEETVTAPVGGDVIGITQVAGGYRIEIMRADERWQIEPLVEPCIAVGRTITQGTILGYARGRLHIARQRGGKWTDLTHR